MGHFMQLESVGGWADFLDGWKLVLKVVGSGGLSVFFDETLQVA